MKLDLTNCTLKDFWEEGHHKVFWVDNETGQLVGDACIVYRISYEEHLIRLRCRKSLIGCLSPLFGKVFTNLDSNIKARFSKNTVSKISSDKAITKSVVNGFSVEEHFEAAENIKQIFEMADYIDSFPDKKGDPNIVAIHRLQKDIELSNSKKCVAYITLKEVVKDGNRIYTQELLLNKYPLQDAGELMSRGLNTSETTAYKCSPRTDSNIT
jgi:hypothetical protein